MSKQKVFLIVKERIEFDNDFKCSVKHPLVRRMSEIQKATIQCFENYMQREPDQFKKVFFEYKTPVYYSSCYAELKSNLNIAQDIFCDSFPVSPLAFQHSVNNCAAAYFSILNKTTTYNLCTSSGVDSFQKLLYWSCNKLMNNLLPIICLVNADYTNLTDQNSSVFCEIKVLTNNLIFDNALKPISELSEMQYKFDNFGEEIFHFKWSDV